MELSVEWHGLIPYADGLALQERAIEERRRDACPDCLLLLEHPPVVTRGSSAQAANLLVSESELAARGVDLYRATRGGDVTYHAPGQLVGYLVMDLAAREACDVHRFLRGIEGALISGLDALGVPARRVKGRTGVFVEQAAAEQGPDRKIASIGVGVRRWITFHGFALNVDLDLAGFDLIVPCGLADVEMTSVARELERCGEVCPGAMAVRETISAAFEAAFGVGA